MYIAAPEGAGPHPAILVIQGMHGATSFDFSVAERLAEHGYVGAVPDLFHRGPGCCSFEQLERRLEALSDSQIIADVNTAFGYLQNRTYVQGDRLGIMGFCMGGRASYMMAALRPDLRAAADLYGGSILEGVGGPAPFDLTPNIHCPILILDGLGIAAPYQLKDVIGFTMLVMVLIFRPSGILGERLAQKKA